MPKSDFRFHTLIRSRWMECDAQGIAFNGSYLGYLEIAQAEYFRNLGFSIYKIAKHGYFDSAVVKTVIEFKSPVLIDDRIELHTRVSNIGNTSLQLHVEIYRESEEVMLSRIEAIYVGLQIPEMIKKRVPDDIRSLIQTFEETGEIKPLNEFPSLHSANS